MKRDQDSAKKITTIDEYINEFPQNIQDKLWAIHKVIKAAAPDATETISYMIPTFKLNGNLVHFAGYKGHIGFYPGATGIEHFQNKLSAYKTSKGTIQFPLDQPFPFDLITEIVKFRVEQNLAKKPKK